jgi:hypothetical protein
VVQDSVLSRIDSRDLAVYVVWEPIFRSDDARASRKATVLSPDDRVKHYWAATRDVGRLFQGAIGLKDEVAWDVYLVYRAGRVWDAFEPPAPDDFMHQLSGRLPKEKMLEGRGLAEMIGEMTPQTDGSR